MLSKLSAAESTSSRRFFRLVGEELGPLSVRFFEEKRSIKTLINFTLLDDRVASAKSSKFEIELKTLLSLKRIKKDIKSDTKAIKKIKARQQDYNNQYYKIIVRFNPLQC